MNSIMFRFSAENTLEIVAEFVTEPSNKYLYKHQNSKDNHGRKHQK